MAQQQQQKHQQSYISSRERSALTENGVLRVENEELRRRLQGVERENQNLQERLENGRRALAALVFKGSELEGVKVEMENFRLALEGGQGTLKAETGKRPPLDLEPAESVEVSPPEAPPWRRQYDQHVAWQTAEDQLWRDGINGENLTGGYGGYPEIEFYGVYLKGLPCRLSLDALCRSIYAGRIHRIFLYNTGPYKSSEALVAFVKSTAAQDFYNTIQAEGLHIAGYEASASEILSDHHSHYGVSKCTQDEIMESGLTRCLLLANLPPILTADTVRRHVEEKIMWVPGKKQTPLVESIVWNENDHTMQLNMAGIYLAQNIRTNLGQRREYAKVRFTYAPDPCEPVKQQQAALVVHHRPPIPSPPPLLPPPPPTFSSYRAMLLSTVNPNPMCRKIVFMHLPYEPRLSTFAQHIRGGVVESIYLYVKPKPGLPVAIVIFKEPTAAWHCYVYLTVTCVLNATLIPFVDVLPDAHPAPTRPPPATARRCVRITAAPLSLAEDVFAILDTLHRGSFAGRPSQLLESITTDPGDIGAAQILFSQIQVARTVITRLGALKQYSTCVFSYGRDPCDRVITEGGKTKKVVRFKLG